MNAAGVKCFCSSLLEIELRCYDVSWCLVPPFSVCLGYGKPFYPQMTLSKNDTIQNRFWTCAVEAVVDFSRVYIRMVDDCALLQHVLWLSHVGPLWCGWSLLAVTHRIRSLNKHKHSWTASHKTNHCRHLEDSKKVFFFFLPSKSFLLRKILWIIFRSRIFGLFTWSLTSRNFQRGFPLNHVSVCSFNAAL